MALTRSSLGLILRDQFNRADSNSLDNDWTEQEGSAAQVAISSNQVSCSAVAAKTGALRPSDEVGDTDDVLVQVNARPGSSGADQLTGVRIRSGPSTFTQGYNFRIDTRLGGQWDIVRDSSSIIATSSSDPPVRNQWRGLRAIIEGTVLTMYGTAVLADGTDLSEDFVERCSVDDAASIIDDANRTGFEKDGINSPAAFDEFFICGLQIEVSGLPSGWQVQVDGRTPVTEDGAGSVFIDIATWALPATELKILNGLGEQQDSISPSEGIWGGDVYAFAEDPSPTPEPPEPAAICSLRLTAYDDDGETTLWQVSTDPEHSRPYLLEPEHYGEQEIDIVQGSATISQVEVIVIDRAQTQGDQDSGWMTERIVSNGIGAIFGRRFKLERYIDEDTGYIVIADGPGGTPRLDESYAAYRWIIRDTRETERKLVAFTEGTSYSFFPPGLEDAPWGYNSVDDTYLVQQADEFATADVTSAFDVDGIVEMRLDNLSLTDVPYTGGMAEVSTFTLVDPGPFGGAAYFQWLNIQLMWRYQGEGENDWRTVTPGSRGGRGPFFTDNVNDPPVEGNSITHIIFNVNTNDGEEAMTASSTVEFKFLYVGPISEKFPFYVEGISVGQFLKNMYDGVYSPRDPITGDIVPSGIRYDADQLALMTTPVRLRLTEKITDARDWSEKHGYAPTGWAPAFDNSLVISPVTQIPPEDFIGVPTIDDRFTEPTPDWDAGERIVNILTFTYPRWYAPEDTSESDAADSLLERTVTIEFRDEASIARYGEESVEFDGSLFAAVGSSFGDQVQTETGRTLADDRKLYVFDRFTNGAQIIQVPIRRSFSSTLRPGSFLIVDLSWIPDYILQRRGGAFGGQILSIRETDCAWRVMVIEELLPLTLS